MRQDRLKIAIPTAICLLLGCGVVNSPPSRLLFSLPLTVNGEAVGDAYIDTGGGFEVLLKHSYDLEIVDEIEVLAFGGQEIVSVTEPFAYSIGGYQTYAQAALVGLSAFEGNGVGFHFFRRTGIVLEVDFPSREADFFVAAPAGDVTIPFSPPPDVLEDFDSAFIDVLIKSSEGSYETKGLLDTGANVTVVRRSLAGPASMLSPDSANITIEHPSLGKVKVRAGFSTTEGLPDLIIGTDVMKVWADRWYFDFSPSGGSATVIFDSGNQSSETVDGQERN